MSERLPHTAFLIRRYVCEADAAELTTKPLLGFAGRVALNVDAGPGGQVDLKVLSAADNSTLATALPLAVGWRGSAVGLQLPRAGWAEVTCHPPRH